jgi:hypothetical protein
MERMARTYGGNAVATFGPCKGQPLADCVCKSLDKIAFLTKERHMTRLAEAFTQDDPMEKCVEDQMKKAASTNVKLDAKEASDICNCLKKKNFSEDDTNIYASAFKEDIKSGREKVLTAQDLSVIKDMFEDEVVGDEGSVEPEFENDVEIGDDLPPLEEIETDVEVIDEDSDLGEETVTLEISQETAEELADAASVAVEPDGGLDGVIEGEPDVGSAETLEVAEEAPSDDLEVTEDLSSHPGSEDLELMEEVTTASDSETEKELAMAMQSHKLRRVGEDVVKLAATPKLIKTVEKDVEAGVPRAEATLGNESAENINVPLAQPSVPRGNAEMGHEGAENINPSAGLPDVPVDSSYLGEEQKHQSDMPAINNEIKGTVIAETEKTQVTAKQLKEVDTVEGDVEAGVPRADASMGNESADNVDVPMADPDVPRGDATMGHEGADNINPAATGPDVPIGDATMGDEKSVQKDMPGTNDEMLKQVQMKREMQQERIASARRMKAVEVTAKLLATARIEEGAYDVVIDALSTFEIDKISAAADNMYPARVAAKTAPRAVTAQSQSHALPAIVAYTNDSPAEMSLQEKLEGIMTIGNQSFDEKLTQAGER